MAVRRLLVDLRQLLVHIRQDIESIETEKARGRGLESRFRVSASEFLELSDAEAMLVNMKLALAKKAKELRQSKKITQNELAKLIGSSQSRVAKLRHHLIAR